MSLDQLPGELIAHMASFCNPDAITNLLLTQKRITKVLKSYKMDKPKFKEVEFTIMAMKSGSENTCRGIGIDGRIFKKVLVSNVGVAWDILESFLEKIQSTSLLKIIGRGNVFQLDKTAADCLLKSAQKIGKLSIDYFDLRDFSPDQFVKFCKKFKTISFNPVVLRGKLFCDDVMTEVVSATNIDECFPISKSKSNPFNKLDLTDSTLDAILLGKNCYNFDFNVEFSANGIRRFIENAVTNNKPFYIKFGFLPADEQDDVNDWTWLKIPYRRI